MHRRTLIVLGAIALGPLNAWAQANFSDAIGTLSSERSLAEEGVAILKRYEPDEFEGRLLYAQAKAAFDELIEQMLADLAQGKDPNISVDFRAKVERGVERQLAFNQRVDRVMKDYVPPGARAGWPDFLASGAGELIKQLVSGGVMVWREWRTASGDRRKEMATRLEAQRWKPFADIRAEQ